MDIYLERFGSIPGQGTFGEMKVGNLLFKTVEREWLDNKKNISCVPAGVYDLIPHLRVSGTEAYALVNHELGVYRYPNEKAKRDLILIHIANTMKDVVGCIGPGKVFGGIGDSFAVYSSGNSMKQIIEKLGREETHTLHITWRAYP